MLRRWLIVGIALVAIISGYLIGAAIRDTGDDKAYIFFRTILPEAARYEPISASKARAYDADGNLIAYIGFAESTGYGGPMLVGTIVFPSGRLGIPVILEHNETPSWLVRVLPSLPRYERLSADDPIRLGYDIDAITGATLTVRAISDAVRESAHSIAISELGLVPQRTDDGGWHFGRGEIAVIILFLLSYIVAQVKQLRKFRLVVLCLGIVILGIRLNRALSIVQFSSLMLGNFPPPSINLLFYIVIIGALLPILLFGKNLYCSHVCPFCGIQELLHKVTGKNITLGKLMIWFARLRNLLLFISLMGVMITANVNIFFYEPFGLAFGLDRNTELYLWVILFAVLALGFVFRRFWCFALCPAGAFLDVFRSLVADIRKVVRSRGANSQVETQLSDVQAGE